MQESNKDISESAEAVNPIISPEAYHLTEQELDELETELFDTLGDAVDIDQDIVSVVVPWDSHLANFGRTYETLRFPGYDNYTAMRDYESNSLFVYTLDGETGKIAHVKRLVKAKSPDEQQETGLTGIEVIDDRLRATIDEEMLDLDTIKETHGVDDISKCWNVTSNLRTKRSDASFFDRPYVLVSYKATFALGKEAGVERLFAYLNPKAIKSLGDLSLSYDLVGDREFHIPEPDSEGEYDKEYTAVCLPYTEENMNIFTVLDEEIPVTTLIANREVPIYSVGNGSVERIV
jgi:hypothetical protein